MFIFWYNTGFSELAKAARGIVITSCIGLWFSTGEGGIAFSLNRFSTSEGV